MECDYEVTKLDRIYLPANGTGINAEEYLLRYTFFVSNFLNIITVCIDIIEKLVVCFII